jgi:sporulation related protein
VSVSSPEPDWRCPRCDAPHAQGQEYCLECGQRLPATTGLLPALGSAWRRRLGWYPGDWVWPALLALVVAAVAGVVSALWLTDTSNSATKTVVATSPAASSIAPTTTAPPEPTTTQETTTPGTTAEQPPGATTAPAKALISWPAGKSGWTVVLDSVPSSNGKAGALAQARQARQLGLKDVGVLDSAQFSSLHPGYYVIFAGIYNTQAEAQSAIIDAHQKGYRGPYPRRIVP